MATQKENLDYLQFIVENQVNIEFCEKIIWLRPRTEGIAMLSEDIGVKLKNVGGDRYLAIKKGVDTIRSRS